MTQSIVCQSGLLQCRYSLRPMLIHNTCFSVRSFHTGFTKSSTVTATRALMLEDTVLGARQTEINSIGSILKMFMVVNKLC